MGSEIVAPEGGITWREVEAAPKENNGEVEEVFEDEDDDDDGTETDEEGLKGLFGREDGSVLSQAFIVNRINNANP
jgi:hypothetical protein